MKAITLDGGHFSDLASFYDEVQAKLTKDLGWNIGTWMPSMTFCGEDLVSTSMRSRLS